MWDEAQGMNSSGLWDSLLSVLPLPGAAVALDADFGENLWDKSRQFLMWL